MRTARHALEQLIAEERFDSPLCSRSDQLLGRFSTDDVAWALETAPGEVLVLRPGVASTATNPAEMTANVLGGGVRSSRALSGAGYGPD